MEHFDELIKAKIEGEVHPFKRHYWSDFCKKAGFSPALSGEKIALISTVTSLLVATGIWLGITLSNKNSNQQQVISQEEIEIAEVDTVSPEEIPFVEIQDSSEVNIPEDIPTKKNRSDRKPSTIESEESKRIIAEPKPVHPPEKEYIIRILTINSDTIGSEYD